MKLIIARKRDVVAWFPDRTARSGELIEYRSSCDACNVDQRERRFSAKRLREWRRVGAGEVVAW